MRLLFVIISFVLLSNCSFDNKTGIWKNENEISGKKENDKIFKDFKKIADFEKDFQKTINLSKDFKINNKDGLLSLGIGTGSFRSKSDIDSNKNNPNLFGGVGVKLASRLSIASSWNGSTLGAGFGISPFYFPLSVSAGVTDITDVNGKGYQYSINIGYSYNF